MRPFRPEDDLLHQTRTETKKKLEGFVFWWNSIHNKEVNILITSIKTKQVKEWFHRVVDIDSTEIKKKWVYNLVAVAGTKATHH
jgi:hypothetical protein